MNEINHAILMLDEMRDEWYKSPSSRWIKNDDFKLMSYQHWAIQEIQNYIRNRPTQHPLDSLDDFCYRVDELATNTSSAEANFIFSVAYDVAMDVIDVFRTSL